MQRLQSAKRIARNNRAKKLTTILLVFFCAIYLIWLWHDFVKDGQISRMATLRQEKKTADRAMWLFWITPLYFVALWSLASSFEFIPLHLVPPPSEVAGAAWRLIVSGDLFTEASASFSRILVGFSFAAVVGTSIGLLAGSFLIVRQIISPMISFVRYIPPTAFVVLLIVYFGIGEYYKYAVVFSGVIFFIIQMVIDVVDDIDRRYLEMAITSGLSQWEIFRRVIIPNSLPKIVDVLRINLSAAWTFLVVAEIVGADTGLGHLIAVSQRFMRLGELFTGILCFGVIGLITDQVIEKAGRRWFRWHYLSLRQ